MRAKSDDVIIYDVIFSKLFLFVIIAVIDKEKFLPKFRQCSIQFIWFYRILMLQVMMSYLNETFYKL